MLTLGTITAGVSEWHHHHHFTMATRPWVISLSRQRRTSLTVAAAERPKGSQGPSKGPPQPGRVSRSERLGVSGVRNRWPEIA